MNENKNLENRQYMERRNKENNGFWENGDIWDYMENMEIRKCMEHRDIGKVS